MTNTFAVTGKAQAVLNVIHHYVWKLDANEMDGLASLLCEDATTRGVSRRTDVSWGEWRGREEIARQLRQIRGAQTGRRRHQLTTPVFFDLSDSNAVVQVYLSILSTLPGKKPELVTTGQYRFSLRRSPEEWQIAAIEAEFDGKVA
jgi:ketosteroid isomerase-like protein